MAWDPRHQRHAGLRRRHTLLRSRHLRRSRHGRYLHALLPARRSVPGGIERQLAEGPPQYPGGHGHLLPGAQPHAARDQRRHQLRRPRRLPVPFRPDADSGRSERQSIQRVCLVSPRAARRDRSAQAGRTVHDAQLAVQPVRARPVGSDVKDDVVVRHALGILPGPDAGDARPGTVRCQHEPDDDWRRRIGSRGPRRESEQDVVRAAAGPDLAPDRTDGFPCRLRDHQRSLLAGQTAPH